MTAPSEPLDPRTARRLRRAVLGWYAAERRDFPWRGTRDPYAVLVSEVMLQQTQASRVTPRFSRFMARFPTAQVLAAAAPADVLAEWSGLGYNRRALGLQRAAAHVAVHGWPADVEGLQRLPGIGPYTARAVASLAFRRPVGVVDTNVRRWLLRRFGGPDDATRLQALADALAAGGRGPRVAAWTHATMELGAAVCRARLPRCAACPLASTCPSRDAAARVPVRRQAPLPGSDRAYRGAVVRLLAREGGGRLDEVPLRGAVDADCGSAGGALEDGRWERVLSALERDGLVNRGLGMVALGEATIAP
ncbi:MAG: A/G-specific adenine glycosylase [Candidatus Limnocylindria bacterium]